MNLSYRCSGAVALLFYFSISWMGDHYLETLDLDRFSLWFCCAVACLR